MVTDTPWQLVKNNKYGKNQRSTLASKSNTTGFVAANGSVPVGHTQKRKLDHDDTDKIPRKMIKMSEDILDDLQGPKGFIWDGENYSCAYDSLLTILLSIWSQDCVKWKGDFKDMNKIMNVLATGFHHAKLNRGSLESARNKIRHLLHQRMPSLFPYGLVGTAVNELAKQLLRSDNVIASAWQQCIECENESNLHNDLQTCVIQCDYDCDCTTYVCLQKRFREHHPRRRCAQCDGEIDNIMRFDVLPKILVLAVSDASVRVSKKISFHDDGSVVVFGLKGIVYFGDFHYTARVCTGGSVWFHDGMVTGRGCTYEKKLSEFTDAELSTCNGKTTSLVIYAQK